MPRRKQKLQAKPAPHKSPMAALMRHVYTMDIPGKFRAGLGAVIGKDKQREQIVRDVTDRKKG